MKSSTLFKRDFKFKSLEFSILNYESPKFSYAILPKRLVIDFLYWQVWITRRIEDAPDYPTYNL